MSTNSLLPLSGQDEDNKFSLLISGQQSIKPMQVTVKLFSFLGQIVGTDRLSVDLTDGASVSDLLNSLSNPI